MYGNKRKQPGPPFVSHGFQPPPQYRGGYQQPPQQHRFPPVVRHPAAGGRGYGGRPPARGRPYQGGYQGVPHQQKKRFFKTDKQVAEALAIFKVRFEEEAKARSEAAAAAATAAATATATASEETIVTETSEDAEAAMTDEAATPATEEPKVEAVKLGPQELENCYKAKTNKTFRTVFKRPVREFLFQFKDLYETSADGKFRMLSDEEVAAAEAAVQAETDARVAKRQKQHAEWQQRETDRLATERKHVLDKAVNVVVASDSKMEQEAVRRAVSAVLNTARHRAYTRVVVVGSGDCDPASALPVGNDAILAGATARMTAALQRQVLIPAPPKDNGVVCHESAYKAILPSEKETVLAAEVAEEAERVRKIKEAKEEAAAKVAASKAKVEAERKAKVEAEAAAKFAAKVAAAEAAGEEAPKEEEAKEEAKEEVKEVKEVKEVMEDETPAPAAPAAPRDMVVGDYYVSIEHGLVKLTLPALGALPTKTLVEAKKPVPAEKEKKEGDAEPTALQVAAAAVAAIRAAPLELTELTEDDKGVHGPAWQSMSWVVVYNAVTGCVARVPTAAITLPTGLVTKVASESEPALKAVAESMALLLDTTVTPEDPHRALSANVLSRWHLLEQALMLALGQLAEKETTRTRVATLARTKAVAEAQKIVVAARQKEKEEREAKAKAAAEAAAAVAAAAKKEEEAAALAAKKAELLAAAEAAPAEAAPAAMEAAPAAMEVAAE